MRGRLLIGAAALLGAMGLAGEANAENCSDYQVRARTTRDLATAQEALNNARSQPCSPLVIAAITSYVEQLSPKNSTDEATSPPPSVERITTPPLPRPPSRNGYAPLTIGETATGNLTERRVGSDNIAFELWSFDAAAGRPLLISMNAENGSSLDPYLALGRDVGGEFVPLLEDDDGGPGLNSQIRFTPTETGRYLIRARTYSPRTFGGYSLIVRPEPPRVIATPTRLNIGEAAVRALTSNSPVADDYSYSYDLWTFQASAGQRFQLSMVSYDIDSFLEVGRMQNGQFVPLANDDDGGRSLNSFLRFVAPDTGEFAIRARSFSGEQYGDYQLMAELLGPVVNPVGVSRESQALVRRGTFSTDEPVHFQDFEIQVRRGRTYNVRVISSEVDPVIDIGAGQVGGQLTEVDFYRSPGRPEREPNEVEFSAQQNGSYIVRVSTLAPTSGRFDLVVSESAR